jgi:hypothetical protein
MPLAVRRFVYSLFAALGFMMMVPFVVDFRRLQAELLADPLAIETALDPAGAGRLQSVMLLFMFGMIVATGFLYAALTTGTARAWRPRKNGSLSCTRCGAELTFGAGRCPACDQQLAW